MMYGLEWFSMMRAELRPNKVALQWTEEELKYVRDWSAAVMPNRIMGIKPKEKKMNFKEAFKELSIIDSRNKPISNDERNYVLLKKLEALGLIKFEEEKKVEKILEVTNNGNLDWCGLDLAKVIANKYGTVRLEQWPEGLVLWVGGRIVWESWKSTTEAYYDQANKS